MLYRFLLLVTLVRECIGSPDDWAEPQKWRGVPFCDLTMWDIAQYATFSCNDRSGITGYVFTLESDDQDVVPKQEQWRNIDRNQEPNTSVTLTDLIWFERGSKAGKATYRCYVGCDTCDIGPPPVEVSEFLKQLENFLQYIEVPGPHRVEMLEAGAQLEEELRKNGIEPVDIVNSLTELGRQIERGFKEFTKLFRGKRATKLKQLKNGETQVGVGATADPTVPTSSETIEIGTTEVEYATSAPVQEPNVVTITSETLHSTTAEWETTQGFSQTAVPVHTPAPPAGESKFILTFRKYLHKFRVQQEVVDEVLSEAKHLETGLIEAGYDMDGIANGLDVMMGGVESFYPLDNYNRHRRFAKTGEDTAAVQREEVEVLYELNRTEVNELQSENRTVDKEESHLSELDRTEVQPKSRLALTAVFEKYASKVDPQIANGVAEAVHEFESQLHTNGVDTKSAAKGINKIADGIEQLMRHFRIERVANSNPRFRRSAGFSDENITETALGQFVIGSNGCPDMYVGSGTIKVYDPEESEHTVAISGNDTLTFDTLQAAALSIPNTEVSSEWELKTTGYEDPLEKICRNDRRNRESCVNLPWLSINRDNFTINGEKLLRGGITDGATVVEYVWIGRPHWIMLRRQHNIGLVTDNEGAGAALPRDLEETTMYRSEANCSNDGKMKCLFTFYVSTPCDYATCCSPIDARITYYTEEGEIYPLMKNESRSVEARFVNAPARGILCSKVYITGSPETTETCQHIDFVNNHVEFRCQNNDT